MVPATHRQSLATIGGTRQIITQSQNKLVAVAAADGKLLWEVPLKTPHEQNSVTPLVVNDVVICAGLDNPTIAVLDPTPIPAKAGRRRRDGATRRSRCT